MKSISKSPHKDAFKQPTAQTDTKVKIIIRLRPILGDEEEEKFVQLEECDTLKILRPGNHSYMKFNNILPSDSNQAQLFELIRQSVDSFLDGINNTIFAYGQTGAGKTYSIIGDYSHLDSKDNLESYLVGQQRGVLSRSLQQIFDETKVQRRKENARILISFIEVYNQKIFDLLVPDTIPAIPLDIRESKQGEIQIIGVLKIEVKTIEEAISLVSRGLKKRVTGYTHANSKSSRSHSVFQIIYEKNVQAGNADEVISSSLKIVDLAGSEKYKNQCERVQQLTNINKSLSCLGHCISALIEKTRTHIPFRDSKLTRILSDSLVGPGKMKFIVCISPSITASAQTFSTLQFAHRAKKAILERHPKHSLSKKSSMSQQFSMLKGEFQKQRELRIEAQNNLRILEQKLLDVEKSNKGLRRQNQDLKLRLRHNQVSMGEQTSDLLKLSVFKENKELMNKNLDVPKLQPIKKPTTLQQKRQKFQKRVKTFIQKESPPSSTKVSAQYSFGKVEYSFQPQHPLKSMTQCSQEQECSNYEEQTFQLYEDCQSLFRSEANESVVGFIQKTCKNMNVNCLNELREDMLRAKNQLRRFQEKDNYLQGLKVSGYPKHQR